MAFPDGNFTQVSTSHWTLTLKPHQSFLQGQWTCDNAFPDSNFMSHKSHRRLTSKFVARTMDLQWTKGNGQRRAMAFPDGNLTQLLALSEPQVLTWKNRFSNLMGLLGNKTGQFSLCNLLEIFYMKHIIFVSFYEYYDGLKKHKEGQTLSFFFCVEISFPPYIALMSPILPTRPCPIRPPQNLRITTLTFT